MVGAAAYLGGFKSTIKMGFGTLMFTTILATIQVALAFSLALQTGSTMVLVATWITLVFDIIGVVRCLLWQGKIYDPSRGYLVLITVANLATIIMFIAGSMGAA